MIVASAFLCLALAAPLLATDNYIDGGIHEISGSSPDVAVGNFTTLNVVAGAAIVAAAGADAVQAYDFTAHVNVSGGSIIGGSDPGSGFANSGVTIQGGTLDITGGMMRGGDADFAAGNGILTYGTPVTISGGTFHGGDVTGFGNAGAGAIVNGNDLLISGGTFTGGDGFTAGAGLALAAGNGTPEPVHAVITGGTFVGGTGGGMGGLAPFSVLVGSNNVSTLDLRGGQFTGGFYIPDGSVLNVYGHGLSITDLSVGKRIAGTLEDGSAISLDSLVYPGASLNLFEVPEPSSFVLGAFGLMALVASVLRRYSIRGAD